MEVRLCTDCKWKSYLRSGDAGPCGAYPDAKRLKEARDQCQGKDWVARYKNLKPANF